MRVYCIIAYTPEDLRNEFFSVYIYNSRKKALARIKRERKKYAQIGQKYHLKIKDVR